MSDRQWDAEEPLQLLIDATRDYAIFMLDPNGIIATWNRGAEHIKGYPAKEAIGRHFSLFYTQDAIDRGHPEYELKVATETGAYTEEGWRIRKDGTQLWASVTITALRDSQGELRGFGKVTRDLTEQKLAAERLRRVDEQFRHVFDGAAIGLGLLTLDGSWLRVNDAMARISGWSRDELVGSSLSALLDPVGNGQEHPLLRELLIGTKSSEGIDTRMVRRDGSPIWARINVGVVADSAGQALHLVAQIEDVSGRIAAENAQRRAVQDSIAATEVLREAERSKSHFLAVASHELRSPLTAILGYATTIDRRWDQLEDGRKRDAVQTIERQGRRLQVLVEDLLTLSSIDAGGLTVDRRPVNLRELIDDVRTVVIEDVEVSGDVDRMVEVDPMRLSQILTNLIVNAGKYGRAPYHLHVDATDDSLAISISDHGDGVPAEFVPRLFDRFAQADEGLRRRSHGTGLGLAICKALAEAHDATLEYSQSATGGACFTLTVPMH